MTVGKELIARLMANGNSKNIVTSTVVAQTSLLSPP